MGLLYSHLYKKGLTAGMNQLGKRLNNPVEYYDVNKKTPTVTIGGTAVKKEEQVCFNCGGELEYYTGSQGKGMADCIECGKKWIGIKPVKH